MPKLGEDCSSAWRHWSRDFAGFADILEILAHQNRQDLLGNFPDLKDTLTRLGGEGALPACLQVMREVCQQWR
jgi:hypothetical protein